MNTLFKSFIIFCMVLFSTTSFSGEADIAITLDHQSLDDLEFGQVIPFSITISNYGPDTAGADSPIEKSISASFIMNQNTALLLVAQDNSIEQSCDFLLSFGDPRPGNTLDIFYSFYYPNIPAGESLTCYGIFEVYFGSGRRAINWNLSSPTDTDPDQSNNTAEMVFGIRPPVVPSLTIISVILLTVMFLIFTLFFNPVNKYQ